MPKMKTHKGAAKRFRITRRGKVMRMKAGGSHLRRKARRIDIYRKTLAADNTSVVKQVRKVLHLRKLSPSSSGTEPAEE